MANQTEFVDLNKTFPRGTWVKVTPNPQHAKHASWAAKEATRNIHHIAGKTVQVDCINGQGLAEIVAVVEVPLYWTEGSRKETKRISAMPDWLIRTEAPVVTPKNAAFEQYMGEAKRADAQRDNNLREVFGFETKPTMEFAEGETVLIAGLAKTASNKPHQFAGQRVIVKNVYRNQAGLWAANVSEPPTRWEQMRMGKAKGKQTVSVLMSYMIKL